MRRVCLHKVELNRVVTSVDELHTGDEVLRGGSMNTERWVVGRPLGIESYKVIATTQRAVDFRVWDQFHGKALHSSNSNAVLLFGQPAQFAAHLIG